MYFKHFIIVAAFFAVAYAMAIEPLDVTANEESQDAAQPELHLREKRGLVKKALLVGGAAVGLGAVGIGAAGLGLGLAKGAYLASRRPVYPYPVYPSYGYPVYPSYPYNYPIYPSYGYGGGWSGSHAYASAGASSW